MPEAGSSTQVMPSKESNDVLPHVFFFIFACLSKLRARSGARVSGGLECGGSGGWLGNCGSGGGVAAAAAEWRRRLAKLREISRGGGAAAAAHCVMHAGSCTSNSSVANSYVYPDDGAASALAQRWRYMVASSSPLGLSIIGRLADVRGAAAGSTKPQESEESM